MLRDLMKGLLAVVLTASFAPLANAQLSTIFQGGAIGDTLATDDGAVLNGLADIADFGLTNLNGSANEGEVLFFANGTFYVGREPTNGDNPLTALGESRLGAITNNNRNYGVLGAGRTDIFFDSGAMLQQLSLQVRGTLDGTNAGGSGAASTVADFGISAALANADARLQIYSEGGFLEATIEVSNLDFEQIDIDASTFTDGSYISSIALINDGPANSAAFFGEITAVPEPTSALLVLGAMGSFAAVRRRRVA